VRRILNIDYGTAGYPENVARRLRAANVAAWIGAALSAAFAIGQFLDPTPGMWKPAAANAARAVILAAIPLLHRFGPLTVPTALLAVALASIIDLSLLLGTGSGMYLYALAAPALAVLFFGSKRFWFAAGFSLAAAGLLVGVLVLLPHNAGLLTDRALFVTTFVPTVAASVTLVFAIVFYAVRQTAAAEAAARREFDRSESLLANILPPSVAARLKEGRGGVIADRYEAASILFADMAGFTARASDTAPDDLVRFLDAVFSRLDSLVERHGLEKIKTTGDAYMVVSGVPRPRADHAQALAGLALDMRDALAGLVDPRGRAVPIRIGIASGPVVAGVVGTRKFFYDVWGDAVNMASRMESTGKAGKIQLAPETAEMLRDGFDLEARGLIEVRGKGAMRTWFLVGRKAAGGGVSSER
jgi:adenylate cyclase